MPLRHDPLVAAAEVVLAVDREARGSGGEDTVGTVGLLTVDPGAVNSIPRGVRLDIDVRDTDLARRDAVLGRIRQAARDAAAARGVGHADALLNQDDPMTSDPAVLDAIEGACAEEGLDRARMISRAYHDCVFMARICPAAMVFVPSKDGISHRPDEYTAPHEIAQGTAVLAGALRRLSA
jgi:N-carbamoyl-L-amino-acid hydrolase